MAKCEHMEVTIYTRLHAQETRETPAEYESRAQCEECGNWIDVADIPEGALVHE